MQDLFSPSKWTATQKLTVSFLVFIFNRLSPRCYFQPARNSSNYLDHLFTAVSMVCVTGLTVLSIKDTYTVFGQIVSVSLCRLGA